MSAPWHVARSLEVLRQQLNEHAPNRSKVSDGGIGDEAHATRDSDHNAWYRNTVTARDFTHDPAHGLDGAWLVSVLVASGDRRLKYIIWSRKIWYPGKGWRAYSGVNAHTHHVHVSVVATPLCESGLLWKISGGGIVTRPTLKEGSEGPFVKLLQERLGILPDGDFGPATERAVRKFQWDKKLIVDGVVGPKTWAKLG